MKSKQKSLLAWATGVCWILGVGLSAQAQTNTYTVTTTADSGEGSLRAAIDYANAQPGTAITFQISGSDSGFDGTTWTIAPSSPLPALVANGTTVDGATQTSSVNDANSSGPEIVLSGGNLSPSLEQAAGLQITAANCVVSDLIINNFHTTRASGVGLSLSGATTQNNSIEGCYIGTDAKASGAASNDIGVAITSGASQNFVGGSEAAARNVISGNSGTGVYIADAGTNQNQVLNNYIGVKAGGQSALPNFDGV